MCYLKLFQSGLTDPVASTEFNCSHVASLYVVQNRLPVDLEKGGNLLYCVKSSFCHIVSNYK